MGDSAGIPHPRDRITLETVIPPMPPKAQRLKKPDSESCEKAVAELSQIIERAEEKLAALKGTIEEKMKGEKLKEERKSTRTEVEQLSRARKELNQEASKLREEKEKHYIELEVLRNDQAKIKPKIKFFDEAEIAQHINSLQSKQEQTSISLNDEKRLVLNLRELEQSKPLLAEYRQRQTLIDRHIADLLAAKARLAEVVAKARAVTEQINGINGVMQDSEEKHKAEIPVLVEERKELERKIEEYKGKRVALEQELKEQNKAYNEQQALIQHIEFATATQKRLREQQERRQLFEERRKEEEATRPHPYGTEISKCDGFLTYLSSLLPASTPAPVLTPSADLATEETGLVVVDRHREEEKMKEGWVVGAEGGKKKKKKREKAGSAVVIHVSVDMLNFLAQQRIKVPVSAEDIPATISAIQAIRDKYLHATSKPAPPKPAREHTKPDAHSIPAKDDFPTPTCSEVVITHGLVLAKEDEEFKERPSTVGARGRPRGRRAYRGGRGRYARGGRPPPSAPANPNPEPASTDPAPPS